ncbi:hypothetical protein [Burkholderia anthina]|uniref:hypothetical protein n=1 Tax=Burkholderia anthina TaxID=179879 RepID=UPI00158EAAEE|nr:hypothetical protein [Burkholderia anthina]
MRNELEREFSQFSERACAALDEGQINPLALVRVLERAFTVGNGIHAVLTLTTANETLREAPSEDCQQPPLSGSTVDALQRLALVSAEFLVNDIEGVAAWADSRAEEFAGGRHA